MSISQNNALWSVEDVAEHLGVSVGYVRHMTSRQQIPHIKIGHKVVRYSKDEIGVWLHRKTVRENANRKRIAALIAAVCILWAQPAKAAIAEREIPAIVNLIVSAESSGRPYVVGDRGKARGLMQIQKSVWQQHTKLPFDRAFDADLNRKVGEKHVRSIVERYGKRASRALVIYTYNTGRFCKSKLPAWTRKHPNKIYRKVFQNELP